MSRLHRAVILAAGESRRLQSLGLNLPKPLIPVQGRPVLAHHLERCAQLGIEEVFINLFYLPDAIQQFVGDGSRWGLKVSYNQEPVLAGTGGCLHAFKDRLRGEPFLVLYGDNFCTFPLEEIKQAHFTTQPTPDMSIVVFEREDVSQSGVVVFDAARRIRSFIEKPAPGVTESHWVNAGVYIISPTLLAELPPGPSDFGRDLIPAYLAQGKRIFAVPTQGEVIAIDTPEMLKKAQARGCY